MTPSVRTKVIHEAGPRLVLVFFLLCCCPTAASASELPPGVAPPARSPSSLVVVDAVRMAAGIDFHTRLAAEVTTIPAKIVSSTGAGCATTDCLARLAESRHASQVILLSGIPNIDEGYDLRVDSWTRGGTAQSQGTCNFCTVADTARLAGKLIRSLTAPTREVPVAPMVPAPIAAPSAAVVPTRAAPPTPAAPPWSLPTLGTGVAEPAPESRIGSQAMAGPGAAASTPGAGVSRRDATRAVGFALLGAAVLTGVVGGVLLHIDGNETGCTEFTTGRVCDSRRASATGGTVALGVGAALAVTGGLVLYGAFRADSNTTVSLGLGELRLRRTF